MSDKSYDRYGPSKLPPRRCDICGEEGPRFHAVKSAGDIMTVCPDCRPHVAGGE
ncbi:MAG TPA: hypothetical protein VIU33_07555 [Nitrospiria bacterium]